VACFGVRRTYIVRCAKLVKTTSYDIRTSYVKDMLFPSTSYDKSTSYVREIVKTVVHQVRRTKNVRRTSFDILETVVYQVRRTIKVRRTSFDILKTVVYQVRRTKNVRRTSVDILKTVVYQVRRTIKVRRTFKIIIWPVCHTHAVRQTYAVHNKYVQGYRLFVQQCMCTCDRCGSEKKVAVVVLESVVCACAVY
jgi:hypothetical protein